MARTILYTYKGEDKTLTFSYQQHRNIHEAVAEAEGIAVSYTHLTLPTTVDV